MKYPENKKYQDSQQEPKQNLTRSLKFRILDDPSKNSLGMNRIKTRETWSNSWMPRWRKKQVLLIEQYRYNNNEYAMEHRTVLQWVHKLVKEIYRDF